MATSNRNVATSQFAEVWKHESEQHFIKTTPEPDPTHFHKYSPNSYSSWNLLFTLWLRACAAPFIHKNVLMNFCNIHNDFPIFIFPTSCRENRQQHASIWCAFGWNASFSWSPFICTNSDVFRSFWCWIFCHFVFHFCGFVEFVCVMSNLIILSSFIVKL